MKYNQENVKKAREYYNQRYKEERQKRDQTNIGWNYEKQRIHLALLTYIKKLFPKRILEVGIGKGDLALKVSKQIENQETHYVGIDISREGVRIAGERIGNQHFHFSIADGNCLPFKKNDFDLVICSEVIEHIIEKKKALLEISRVLKVGGSLLLTTPNPKSLTYMLPRVANKIKKFQYGSNQPVEEHIERRKLAGMLKSQGFEILSHTGLLFKPYTVNMLEGRRKQPLMIARWISEYIERKNFLPSLGLYQVVWAKNRKL